MSTQCEVSSSTHFGHIVTVNHGTDTPWMVCGYHAFESHSWHPAGRECDEEFGLHEHDDEECGRTLDGMADPFGGYDPWQDEVDAYSREAEESMLGRPLFPNEY